jgi:hypothetical protein
MIVSAIAVSDPTKNKAQVVGWIAPSALRKNKIGRSRKWGERWHQLATHSLKLGCNVAGAPQPHEKATRDRVTFDELEGKPTDDPG